MNYGICNQSIVAMRLEPSHRSEMVSQMLFGELFTVLEKHNEWLKVKCEFDEYEGWLVSWQTVNLTMQEFHSINATNIHLCNDLIGLLETGMIIPIVIGSNLPHYDNNCCTIMNKHYMFNGQVRTVEQVNRHSGQLIENAYMYLHSPYLWGGRSPFGIDCSGFTQMVYKLSGFRLMRDAALQAEIGSQVHLTDEIFPGDLAFFDNEEGRITHVGIMLSKNKIIHASGRVRIDNCDHYGIFNDDLKRYTHKLRLMKRIL